MDRRRHVLDLVQPNGRKGVEIGPLTRPLLLRDDAGPSGSVLYADRVSTEALRRHYAHDANLGPGGIEAIAEVDIVLEGQSLAEALGERSPVDYIVASHVFEHVADPIRWLVEAGQALAPQGLLCLILPDKRFTFDHFRPTTRVGEMIGAYLAGPRQPEPASAYDQIALACTVNPFAVWRGEAVDPAPIGGGGPREALRVARLVAEGLYYDAHCSVFTPYSFAAAFSEVAGLGLIPFACAKLTPSLTGTAEFFALLRKADEMSPEARAASFPRLDPARHHALPRKRLRPLARAWRRLRGRR